MRQFDIIGTINTKTIDEKFLDDLYQSGVTVFRINGAHIEPDDIPKISGLIRKQLSDKVKIQVDLEGSKIRTKNICKTIFLQKGKKVDLKSNNFNQPKILSILNEGDTILSSDGQIELVVDKISDEEVTLLSLCTGVLQNNKGIHIKNKSLNKLPVFTEKDTLFIKYIKKNQIDYAGISFVRSPEQVLEALTAFSNSRVKPIIKLETKEATEKESLRKILELHDTFSIDRGDLISEVGMTQFPSIFNYTLEQCLSHKKRIFVATQIFASMVDHNIPYISEIIEFHRLYQLDITGIQLSEEISIGKNPLEILKVINNIIMDGEH